MSGTRKFFSFIFLLTILSCSSDEVFLSYESLFKLGIGVQEDQLNVFNAQDTFGIITKNDFYFSDNMFFISDPNSGKVMNFTSYGDLISLFYNPQKNPELSLTFENNNLQGDVLSSRIAVSYPFNDIGNIAYSSDNFYIEDSIDDFIEEKENNILIKKDSIIRVFDKESKYIGYIGQEGLNGKPFSYIQDIFINYDNYLFVVVKLPSGFVVYCYDSSFTNLYKVKFDQDSIPLSNELTIAYIENIFPDRKNSNYFYLKVDFYKAFQEMKEIETFNNLPSKIYRFNIEKKDFDKSFKIPNREGVDKSFYSYIGSSSNNNIFFISTFNLKESLLLALDQNGNTIFEKEINTELESATYHKFFVSKEGILTYLIGFKDRFEVRWWRSDKSLKRFIF